eukprot:1136738-Pelagomonas_calceolata.AAC.1
MTNKRYFGGSSSPWSCEQWQSADAMAAWHLGLPQTAWEDRKCRASKRNKTLPAPSLMKFGQRILITSHGSQSLQTAKQSHSCGSRCRQAIKRLPRLCSCVLQQPTAFLCINRRTIPGLDHMLVDRSINLCVYSFDTDCLKLWADQNRVTTLGLIIREVVMMPPAASKPSSMVRRMACNDVGENEIPSGVAVVNLGSFVAFAILNQTICKRDISFSILIKSAHMTAKGSETNDTVQDSIGFLMLTLISRITNTCLQKEK